MEVVLGIKSGPLAGKSVLVSAGRPVLIGRAPERAQFSVPHDNLMSGIHFAVECGTNGCRVVDKKSTNGTFLNGARIQAAILADCDEIKSGQTIFVVRIVPDGQLSAPSSSTVAASPKPPGPAASMPQTGLPPALAIGSWAFHKIPEHWQIQEGLGIQQIVKDAFPASVGVTEEPMGRGITLAQYVEAHTKMFREHLPEPKIDAAAPPAIHGSEETAALNVRYTIKDGPSVCYHRVYARCGSTIGVLTLTALQKDLDSVRPLYDSVLSTISFSHKKQA